MSPAPPLTNLQRELLDLFAMGIPDEDLREVKRLLARYFAGKATVDFDRLAGKQGLTPEDLERWTHEHRRAATDGDGASGAPGAG